MEIICKSLFFIASLLAIIVKVSGVIYGVVVNNFSLVFVTIFVFEPICTNIFDYFEKKLMIGGKDESR
jgi:predicted Co/Zn/Cd cation transporter (cation efflux family)